MLSIEKYVKSQHASENSFMHTHPLIILFMCQYHNEVNECTLNLSQALIIQNKAIFFA